jgi:hypothetical protein
MERDINNNVYFCVLSDTFNERIRLRRALSSSGVHRKWAAIFVVRLSVAEKASRTLRFARG